MSWRFHPQWRRASAGVLAGVFLLWGCPSPTSGPAGSAPPPPAVPSNDPVTPYDSANYYVYIDPETGTQDNDSPLTEFVNGSETTCSITEVTTTPSGIPEGPKAFRFQNTATSWSAGGWINATPADLSGFNALVLHVLALPSQFNGQFRVKIGDASNDSQEVTVPFVPDGTWKQVILSLDKFHGFDRTAVTKPFIFVSGDADHDDIFYVDYIHYTTVPGLTPSSGPTSPTFTGNEVVLFSDAPLNGATSVSLNWATWSSAPESHLTLSGNTVKKLRITWMGYDLGASADVSSKSDLHVRVWADGLTALKVKLVDFMGDGYGGSNGDSEYEHTLPLNQSQIWTTLVVPLTVWTSQGVPLSDLRQLVLIGVDGNGTDMSHYYLDDLYFD